MRYNHNKDKEPKMCFISYSFSSFIKQDYEVLSKHFNISRIQPRNAEDILKLFINILKTDISYSWFASEWAFFTVLISRIFQKKSVIIAGGYDVADVPEINYGMCARNRLKQWMTKFALKHANVVLAVSNFTKKETEKYTKNNVGMIYNCVNLDKFDVSGIRKEIVLTVGNKIKLKGIDTFVLAAHHFQNKTFIIIGLSNDSIIELKRYCDIPNNVKIVGIVSNDEVVKYYQQAKVYCQLSYRESFGMSLAESMACGCVPVVTCRGAMQEVVGDTGNFCKYGDVDSTVLAIKKALKSDGSIESRQRIVDNFSMNKREEAIVKCLTTV